MNVHDVRYLLALVNFGLSCGIGWVCLCRLNVMTPRDTQPGYRISYAVLLMAATASGFTPLLFGEWPGPAHVLLSAALLLMLISRLRHWRAGLPDYARKEMRP